MTNVEYYENAIKVLLTISQKIENDGELRKALDTTDLTLITKYLRHYESTTEGIVLGVSNKMLEDFVLHPSSRDHTGFDSIAINLNVSMYNRIGNAVINRAKATNAEDKDFWNNCIQNACFSTFSLPLILNDVHFAIAKLAIHITNLKTATNHSGTNKSQTYFG